MKVRIIVIILYYMKKKSMLFFFVFEYVLVLDFTSLNGKTKLLVLLGIRRKSFERRNEIDR